MAVSTQETRITVRRPDGSTEIVAKPGTIIAPAMRRKMEQATRDAGRGEIVGWEIIGQPASGPTMRQVLYGRDRTRCRGCGRIGDDGECGLGNY